MRSMSLLAASLLLILSGCEQPEQKLNPKLPRARKVKVKKAAAGPIIDLPKYGSATFDESNGKIGPKKKHRTKADKQNLNDSDDSDIEFSWGKRKWIEAKNVPFGK